MPLKSKAQIAKWGELVKQGKISQDKFDEALSVTPKHLPERIGPKKIRSTDDIRANYKKRFGV